MNWFSFVKLYEFLMNFSKFLLTLALLFAHFPGWWWNKERTRCPIQRIAGRVCGTILFRCPGSCLISLGYWSHTGIHEKKPKRFEKNIDALCWVTHWHYGDDHWILVPLGGIEFMVISIPFNAKLTERVDQFYLSGRHFLFMKRSVEYSRSLLFYWSRIPAILNNKTPVSLPRLKSKGIGLKTPVNLKQLPEIRAISFLSGVSRK